MSKESKNLHQARAYARQFKSEADASLLIETIRKEIPNSRLLNYKFMHGVVRMSLEGEIKTGNDIADINRALEFIASDAHKDEYDKDFNGDKLSVLTTRFAEVVHDAVRGDMEKIENLNLGEYNKEYTIVPVPDYETASKYSEFTSWCITHHSNMYDSYTNDGLGTFYFCLKDGYDKLPNTHVGNPPLDEYGLSMIAVSVRADGSMNTCTCRWNHDNGGGDAIMTTEDLSKLLGVNFYKAFHAPKLPEEIKGCKVLLDDGKVITVGEFDSRSMTAIAVQVKDDLFICLRDEKYNGERWVNWHYAKEVAEKSCKGSFLPSMDELRLWRDNKKIINGALAAVGGEPLQGWYWSRDLRSSDSAGRMNSNGNEDWDYTDRYYYRRSRAFVRVVPSL